MMPGQVKKRLYQVLEVNAEGDLLANVLNYFIVALIAANVLAIILDTVKSIEAEYSSFLYAFEVISVIIFTIEYALRMWVCTEDPRYRHPAAGRLRHAATPLAIIDLLAFLPFYLPMVFPFDLRVLRVFRLFRILRLLKLARYSESMRTLGNILKNKREDIVIALFIGLVMLVISSTLMYYAEHDAQPDKFASIPDTLWWGVITLATIGYGDVYPVTPLGKVIGGFTALIGIGLFALPAGLLGSAFVEELERKKEAAKQDRFCPHCGKRLDDVPLVQELYIKK